MRKGFDKHVPGKVMIIAAMVMLYFTFFKQISSQIIINEIMADNTSVSVNNIPSGYPDWIEIYNHSGQQADISGMYLSDDSEEKTKWRFPPGTMIPGGGYMVIAATGNNTISETSFKLDKDGESVFLFNHDLNLVDSVSWNRLYPDITYGRGEDNMWHYFKEPTPGTKNNNLYFGAWPPEIELSVPPGFYKNAIQVSLKSPPGNGTLYYTLDGSLPDVQSDIYQNPLTIENNAVLKLYYSDPSNNIFLQSVNSYFINNFKSNLPTLSLSFRPSDFYDDSTGIYVSGKNGTTGHCSGNTRHNYNQDWEREVYFEYFSIDGEKVYESPAGAKVHGQCTRNYPQKSLALFARSVYGNGKFSYPFFSDREYEDFEALLLRNGGSDNPSAMIRDAVMQELTRSLGEVDYQSYNPVSVYFNGNYQGMYYFREKLNEHYIQSSDGFSEYIYISNDKIYENNYFNFLFNMDSTITIDNIKYNYDLLSFINYIIINIYGANIDWPINNQRFWYSPETTNGWRWIFSDGDLGLGYGNTPATHATLNALKFTDPEVTNTRINCSHLFNDQLNHPGFAEMYVAVFESYLRDALSADRVIAITDSIAQLIGPEMQFHCKRWNRSYTEWEGEIEKIKNFIRERNAFLPGYLEEWLEIHGNRGATLTKR